ncbi:hypothetical protein DFJ58DRAFT_740077 [Suillus subalutaceus]|uniref:uncharacterized protein n=1 Tax=Suillus subalutaceus TaxID=48586 RepID=UPI001B87A2CB|nr:uncharacterized protein DFJ58DRAFT_740077 [Suillus subalutaceus]KAG1813487.1 hypothetical protein DFJ58DRAFT_740077 [Suillus subalutaceus]
MNAGDTTYTGLISQHLLRILWGDNRFPHNQAIISVHVVQFVLEMQDWQKDHGSHLQIAMYASMHASHRNGQTIPHGADGLDPPNPTRSVFILDEEVAWMEAHVLACRGSLPGRGTKRKKPEGNEDGYEDGMRIPNQRLFVLNAQVRHLDGKNLDTFGEWLSHRWTRCQTKKSSAEHALRQLSVDEANIRPEWRAQVEHHTKPLSRRSKTNNDEQISKILTLERTLSNLDDSVHALEMQLCAGNTLNNVDFNLRLADERTHRSKVADTLRRWKASLGIGQLNDLQQLRRWTRGPKDKSHTPRACRLFP